MLHLQNIFHYKKAVCAHNLLGSSILIADQVHSNTIKYHKFHYCANINLDYKFLVNCTTNYMYKCGNLYRNL